MIFTLIIVFISLAIFLDYIGKKRRNDVIAGMPGPTEIPLFGNYYIFIATSTKAAVELMKKHSKKYNGLSKCWIFNKLSVMITRPDYLECVISGTKHIKKSVLYNTLGVWLGDGLLLSNGSKWHSRRKVITPAFHFKILEQFIEVFDQQSNVLVEQLKKHADGKTAFNVYPFITLAALDVISETAMGVQINAQTDSNCQYVRAVSDISEIIMHRLANNFYQNDFIFKLFSPAEKRRHDEALDELHSFTENVIKQRRRALETKMATSSNDNQDEDIGTRKKMAFLDILLQSTINGKPLTNADIREEVDTFMFEGHDTTTSGVSFALYLISRHSEIQQKMFEEIRHVIGDDKTKPVGHNELMELKYTERVIKEALRMFPPVALIGREFTEDATVAGYRVPAGTELIAPLFIMMRDEKFFPNPNKFDPDRHSPENSTEKTNPYAYIPFSAGPRNCIGQKFAMLEMKNILSKILRHYELLPLGDEPDVTINIVMKSTNGVQIGIRPRVY